MDRRTRQCPGFTLIEVLIACAQDARTYVFGLVGWMSGNGVWVVQPLR